MDVKNLNDTQSSEVSSSCSSCDTDFNPQQTAEQSPLTSEDTSSSSESCDKHFKAIQFETKDTTQQPTPISSTPERTSSPRNCPASDSRESSPTTSSSSKEARGGEESEDLSPVGVKGDASLLSECSKGKDGDSVAKMVQGNGFGDFVLNNVSPSPENVAKYFAMPSVNNNMKISLGLGQIGSAFNAKYPGLLQKKENAFHRDFACENRSSPSLESNNSDEDEDVEIINDNAEVDEWSFDEEEEAVTPGKQCACVFRHSSSNENTNKTPLKQQDSNQESPSTSHSPLHTNSFLVSCTDCEQSFGCRVELNRHRLKHIGAKSFKCSRCDKSFAFSFNLKSHERQHTGEKPYVCNKCGLSFVHAFNFHEHQRGHNNRSHFVCSICLQWFSAESKYLLHIRKHSSIKPFKCSMCGKVFHRAAGLRAHELLHSVQKEDQRLFSCTFCDRTFVRLAHKQMHEQVHLSEKLFPCLRCGNSYTDISVFKSHTCLQTNGNLYKCNVCSETFQSPAILESHSKTHILSKASTSRNNQGLSSKFNTFKRKSPLASAKKRFPCKLCSRTFSSRSLLDNHSQIHQREYTPYMCKECCLTFTHANYLKLHLSMHQDQTSLQCDPCPQKFPSKFELESRAKMCTNNVSSPQGQLIRNKTPSPVNVSPKSGLAFGMSSVTTTPVGKSLPILIKSEPQ